MSYDYRTLLREELTRRQTAHRSYSLRAYARDLGLTAPQLSSILAGKKGLSIVRARDVCEALELSADETEIFISSVAVKHARSTADREIAQKHLSTRSVARTHFALVQDARFRIIADWYHLAILHLSETTPSSWEPRAIAQRLGLSTAEVSRAIQALLKADLIRKVGHSYERTESLLKTDDIPSRAIRLNHHQMIAKASAALEEQAIDERDFSSVVLAIDARKMPEFKERLRTFREDFCLQADKPGPKQSVYALSMQFYRLSKS